MKFPKKWIDVVNTTACGRMMGVPKEWGPDIGLYILEALASAGALKTPPKPRNFYICKTCIGVWDKAFEGTNHYSSCTNPSALIHVREVIDE